MNIIPPNEYKAAIYLRLSRDEDTKQESNSITNQRQILTNYANSRATISLMSMSTTGQRRQL